MAGKLSVYARVRPLSVENIASCVLPTVTGDSQHLITTMDRELEFDGIFQAEHSTSDVFQKSIKPLYKAWCEGKNVSVLCYGQTCSGKTYTAFGSEHSEEDSPIVKGIAQIICDKLEEEMDERTRLFASFIEVYNEEVFDLLKEEQKPIPIRENERGQFVIPQAKKEKIKSTTDALAILTRGHKQKRFGNSAVHDRSSRSHTILRLYMVKIQGTGGARVSELNLVDLAGSEVFSHEFGSKQQEETKNINLSLLALKRTMDALAQKSCHVPYRQSALTKLLQNSLGGDSYTTLLCMVSPLPQHWSFTKGTLLFGQIVRTIVLPSSLVPIKASHVHFNDSADVNSLKSLQEVHITSDGATGEQMNCVHESLRKVNSALGKVAVHELSMTGNEIEDLTKPLVVILHAYGSGCSGMDWNYLFAPLLLHGYAVIAPDFPGFGESADLQRVGSRTEDQVKEPGSSLSILHKIISTYLKRYGARKVLLFGYDYGGGLALTYALKYPKVVFRIVLFHPTWTRPLAPLNQCKTKTLILWVPVEQLHVYSRGVKISKALPNASLIKLSIGNFSNAKAAGYYHSIGQRIQEIIITWLPPLQNIKKTIKPINTDVVNAPEAPDTQIRLELGCHDDFVGPDSVDTLIDEMINSSSFLPNVAEAKKEKRKKEKEREEKRQKRISLVEEVAHVLTMQEAIHLFVMLCTSGNVINYYRAYLRSSPERPASVRLFSLLPVMDPSMIELSKIMEWGIWPDYIRQWNGISDSKLYVPGCQVLARLPVQGSLFTGEDFLSYIPESPHHLLTYRTKIKQIGNELVKLTVDLPRPSNCTEPTTIDVTVALESIQICNNPTQFPVEAEGYMFEDKVHCRYSNLLTRAKLMEAAVCVAKILQQEKESTVPSPAVQIRCLQAIWGCIDLTHFDHVGLHPTRSSKPEVGQLAYFGQGNCHTLASVLAAFLLPFGKFLGWCVTFRAGFFYKPNGRDGGRFDGVPLMTSDHTWLEVTLLPSLERVVCDPSFDEIGKSFSDIYAPSGMRHPLIRAQCKTLPTFVR